MEVIVGTYEELTLGYRFVKDSEEHKVVHVMLLSILLSFKKLRFNMRNIHVLRAP